MAKKNKQNAIRLSSDFFDLAVEIAQQRGADNFSEYVRGLILMDIASFSPNKVLGHEIPAWVTRHRNFKKLFLLQENKTRKER